MTMSTEKQLTFQLSVLRIDDQTVQYTLTRPESYWNLKQLQPFLSMQIFKNQKG